MWLCFLLKTSQTVESVWLDCQTKGLFVLQNVACRIENNDKQNVDNG